MPTENNFPAIPTAPPMPAISPAVRDGQFVVTVECYSKAVCLHHASGALSLSGHPSNYVPTAMNNVAAQAIIYMDIITYT